MDKRLIFRYFSCKYDGGTHFDRLSVHMVEHLSNEPENIGKSVFSSTRVVGKDFRLIQFR